MNSLLHCFNFARGIISLFLVVNIAISQAAIAQDDQDLSRQESTNHQNGFDVLEVYKKVLDLAFPRTQLQGPNTSFALLLRFEPSFHPESQIVIRRDRSGNSTVDYLQAEIQGYKVLMEYAAKGNLPDITEAVRQMNIKYKSIAVTDKTLRGWFHSFMEAFSDSTPTLEKQAYSNMVQLDGTLFALEYKESTNHISFILLGPELGLEKSKNPSEYAVINWMINVRKEIEKLSEQD